MSEHTIDLLSIPIYQHVKVIDLVQVKFVLQFGDWDYRNYLIVKILGRLGETIK